MDPLRWRESWHSGITYISKNYRQTPASCSNIALHNLYPGEIDLLVCCGLRVRPRPHSNIFIHLRIFHPVVRAQFGEEHVL
jgi:hypothetical protein